MARGDAHVIPAELIEALQTVGVLGTWSVVGWAVYTGRLVTRREHDEVTSLLRRERDAAITEAERLHGVAETALSIAQHRGQP